MEEWKKQFEIEKENHCEIIKTVTKTNLKENCTDIDLLLKKKEKKCLGCDLKSQHVLHSAKNNHGIGNSPRHCALFSDFSCLFLFCTTILSAIQPVVHE